MPTILFPLTYLNRLTDATPAQLAQQAFDYGLEATLKTDVLEVEVTAERPDLLAAEGFTRAINIYNGKPRSIPDQLAASDRRITVAANVADLRPYIGGLVVENVDLGQGGLEALIQFQEKITQTFGRQRKKIAIGVYDLAQIQGNLVYRAEHKDDLAFIPLNHADPEPSRTGSADTGSADTGSADTSSADTSSADTSSANTSSADIGNSDTGNIGTGSADAGHTGSDRPRIMTAREILADHPHGSLYGHTLPDSEFVTVLRDSAGTVLSMPPIINAAGVGALTSETKHLFIDVTGISARTVQETINIIVHNFLDIGAQVKTVAIQSELPETPVIMPDLARRSIDFSAKFLNQIVGTSILKTDLNRYLARMDLYATGTGKILVPSYRTDIFSETDVAGDLLVAVGIDNLSADFSALRFHNGKSDPLKDFAYSMGDLAQRMGLMEVKNFVLSDPAVLHWFSHNLLQTSNAKSRTYSVTRPTLQAGLLEILSRNINAPKPLNIYEIGEVVYCSTSGAIVETLCWSFASFDAKASFATAKAYLQTLLKALNIPYELAVCSEPRYIPGRSAVILVKEQVVGHFGEIHPEILNYFSFPEPICSGELDCRSILSQQSQQSH